MAVTNEVGRALAFAMTEAALLAHVRAAAKQFNWWTYHTHNSKHSEPGWPDLVLIHQERGQLAYVELKTMKGHLSAAQQNCKRLLESTGAYYDVWRPDMWVSGSIERFLAGAL